MPYVQFKTRDGKNFITSDAKNFKVFVLSLGDVVYYDSISLDLATRTLGIITGGNFTSLPGITNVTSLVDQGTGPTTSFSGSTSIGVRFDLGSSKAVDFLCMNFKVTAGGHSAKLFGSNTADSSYVELASKLSPPGGWSIITFNSASYRYLVFQIEESTVSATMGELIIGAAWDIGYVIDAGAVVEKNQSIVLELTDGGIEFSTKRAEPKTGWNYVLSGIDSSLKTELESLRDGVDQTRKKYIYYKDIEFNYVALDEKSLKFQKIDGIRYKTNLNMELQHG